MIYIASPYTHADPHEIEYRYEKTLEATAMLFEQGHHAFSPIVHCHPVAKVHGFRGDYAFWSAYNLHMLSFADELWVLQLDGWNKSIGVQEEIIHALKLGKPVIYFDIEGFESGEDNQHGGI